MKYNPPVGGAADDPYIDGSSTTEGSIPPAASIEDPQRELVAAISGAGLTPDDADLTQLLQAIQIFAGGHVTTISADAALTVAEAGLILIDATVGNVTVTLPAANTMAGLAYTLARVDTSANTVTIAPNGADTVDGAASLSLTPGARREIKADDVSDWVHASPRKADSATLLAGTDDESFATAKGLFQGFLGAGATGANGHIEVPFRETSTGNRNTLILQWMTDTITGGTSKNVALPVAFPVACRSAHVIWSSTPFSGGSSAKASFAVNAPDTGHLNVTPTDASGSFSVFILALGT